MGPTEQESFVAVVIFDKDQPRQDDPARWVFGYFLARAKSSDLVLYLKNIKRPRRAL